MRMSCVLKTFEPVWNFTPVWKIQTKEKIWTTTNTWRKAFYLGYLWSRSFPPPKKPSSPPKKILLLLPCIRNYIEKIIQTRRGQCTWSKFSLSKATIRQRRWSRLKNKIKYHCNISQNCVSKCTRLHLSACSFQNISAGGMPPDPSRNPGILLHLPKPTSHRRCANRNSSATIPKKELHMGNLTAACYENKRVLKVINTITMVTVLLWLRTLLTSPCGGFAQRQALIFDLTISEIK